MFFFCSTTVKQRREKNKQAKCCKYDGEGIFMTCKSQCSFTPQCFGAVQRNERIFLCVYQEVFFVTYWDRCVLCDFYITVSCSFRCQVRSYEKRKRAKSWNICLGSPFFFIYWNINVFAWGQVCLCLPLRALTEMPTDALSLIFFHCGCICLSRGRQSPYHPPCSPAFLQVLALFLCFICPY